MLFFILARVFRKTLGSVDRPSFVLEQPPLPKDLAAVVLRLEKWKAEGRLSREDHERLMQLCREDAEGGKPLTKM